MSFRTATASRGPTERTAVEFGARALQIADDTLRVD
jgi:hypothetical protein